MFKIFVSSLSVLFLVAQFVSHSNESDDQEGTWDDVDYIPDDNELYQFEDRVMGGGPCYIETIPFVVGIRTNLSTSLHKEEVTLCGGSLLTLQWVVTSAHCIYLDRLKKNQVILSAGSTFLIKDRSNKSKRNNPQIRLAVSAVLHPGYKQVEANSTNIQEYINDIGLIKSESPFTNSETLDTALLPSRGMIEKCETVFIAGWGNTEYLPKGQLQQHDHLRCTELPLITIPNCLQIYNSTQENITSSLPILCTHRDGGGQGSCLGDSGGPLICKGVVVGLMLGQARNCADAYYPGINLRIDKYINFIFRELKLTKAQQQAMLSQGKDDWKITHRNEYDIMNDLSSLPSRISNIYRYLFLNSIICYILVFLI